MAKQQSRDSNEKKTYQGIEVESDEEVYILMWLFDLQEQGYIKKIERAQSFTLSGSIVHRWVETKQLKTKSKAVDKQQILLHEHVYTPEFKIIWDIYPNKIASLLKTGKMEELLIAHMQYNEVVSYLEVKPAWDHQNMTRLFKINQKWMYEKYGIYVNLLEPISLFQKTWTPEAYRKTPTGKERKINWEVGSIGEYLTKTTEQ